MNNRLLYCLISILLFAACQKDEMTYQTKVETLGISSVVDNTATSGGVISSDGRPTIKECGIEWCTTDSFNYNVQKSVADKPKLGEFSCVMTNLQQRTKYFFRAYAKNDYGVIYGQPLSFTSQALPIVITSEIEYTTGASFTTGGEVTDDGDSTILARGVCWDTDSLPTIDNNHTLDGNGTGKYVSIIEGLSLGTKYYVRAYAQNAIGIGYGETKSVTTYNYPSVTTNNVSDISYTSAKSGGVITDNGGTNIISCGVCWSVSPAQPSIENPHTQDHPINDIFSSTLFDLEEGKTYNVRAYAINSIGIAYGECVSFQTDYHAPTIVTSEVTNITATSATCGGNVTSDGGSTVTERGICYSTSQNPTTSNSKVGSGSGTGSFTSNISDLNKGTTYYVRAYAINSKGTAYGEQKSFTTDATIASVTTTNITNITATFATCGGNVTTDGGTAVTDRGVCYSTSQNPTTSNNKVTGGSGTGSFTCNISNLNKGTTYYVRAYAINSKGTAYGEQKSFTTRYEIPSDQLTFVSHQNGSSIGLASLASHQTIEYSTDGITWNNFTTSTTVTLDNGNSVYVRGMLTGDNDLGNYTQFNMSGSIEAKGNINYLWNYENPEAPLKMCCGVNLFKDCSALTEAPTLSATTLTDYCYSYMFHGCTKLTTAPSLPATTLAKCCYAKMFQNCSSLATAQSVLPAMVLNVGCYEWMFWGCKSLTTAPALPATTLAERCYDHMFFQCSSLVNVPTILPATSLAESCYYYMFAYTKIVTAPKLPATVLVDWCYADMFVWCTSLTTAPELPATILTPYCYSGMFHGCQSLKYIKCLATDTSASSCTNYWVANVASSGTFVKNSSMNSWTTGSNGIPNGWTVVNQ